MKLPVLSLLFINYLRLLQAQESAQYLRNAIRDLKYLKGRHGLQRIDATIVQQLTPDEEDDQIVVSTQKPVEKRIQLHTQNVPPLSLTKGELAALYESAVAKGETIKLDTGDNTYVHAAVHELDESPSFIHEQKVSHPAENAADSGGGDDGYYYYYYPVKSFLDEMTSQASSNENHYSHVHHPPPTRKPNYQYHSHTHQHNVKISSSKDMEHKDKDKNKLEPLFMAISGFIGMAVMFVLSVIVFPKFGIKKPTSLKNSIKKSERITDIARIALQAIEGKNCAERFACELEKTARAFNLQDNRIVKMIKRYAPLSFGKQMDRIGKYSNKRLQCKAIPCKKKNPPAKKKPNPTNQKKT